MMSMSTGTGYVPPILSLHSGTWFKLICGASSHDVSSVRNQSFVYSLAGADCIDCAADSGVIRAAKSGIDAAVNFYGAKPPLLMISHACAEDPHFRKARFDPLLCPDDCPRPCERVCPADAIDTTGVNFQRCYGCGRCAEGICPLGLIVAVDHRRDMEYFKALLQSDDVDALEIHMSATECDAMAELCAKIAHILPRLKLLAISFPDPNDDALLKSFLINTWDTLRRNWAHEQTLIWQTDGRPMSGDIGVGTARASVNFSQKVGRFLVELQLPGFVQLAGGTNDRTGPLLRKTEVNVGGAAFGGYARKILRADLDILERNGLFNVEQDKQILHRCVSNARSLVRSVKCR